MKFFPSIVDAEEAQLLKRKGAAALAIFKVVTVVIIGYAAQAVYKGVEVSSTIQAYLIFAGSVLAIFTGGNAVEHTAAALDKKPKANEGAQ